MKLYYSKKLMGNIKSMQVHEAQSSFLRRYYLFQILEFVVFPVWWFSIFEILILSSGLEEKEVGSYPIVPSWGYNWMNSTDEILFLGENAHEDFKQRTISYVYYIFQPWMLYRLQWNTDKELLLNASVHQAQPTKTNHSRFMKRLECL